MDSGLTKAEQSAIKWLNVKERFEKTDDGCACSPCAMIRMMISAND